MKRIGLLMSEIISPQDNDLLEGVHSQAARLGYDVIVFTGVLNAQRELRFDSYIAGLENIYSLVCMSRLDGVVFAAERFRSAELIEKIYGYLEQTDIPCIVLGDKREGYISLNAPEYDSMYRITKHLIDEHSCRKLCCITGVPGQDSSLERLQGFRDACSDSGIAIDDKDIFYGYFWKEIPAKIGEDIAAGRIDKPDAVVCANDVMAVSLIETLQKHDIRVPEDIAVTGFDGGWDSVLCDPSVTTVSGRDRLFGAEAVCRLYEMMTGDGCERCENGLTLQFGRSCGCSYEDIAVKNGYIFPLISSMRKMQRDIVEKRPFIATDFIHRMSGAFTISELSDSIDEVGHIFSGWDWFDICLCSDWQAELNNPNNFRQYGFSDDMFLLLSKRRGTNEKSLYNFPARQLLPTLNEPHEPKIVVMTSLHCEGQIFGYCSLAYTDTASISIDEYLVSFCDSISSALTDLQKKLYAKEFSSQLAKLSVADPVSGMLNRRGFMMHLPEILSRDKYSGRKSFLLMLTYYPDEFALGDPSDVIADIIRNACGKRLCARLEDKVYSIILSVNDDETPQGETQQLVSSFESSIRTRFGMSKTINIPDFITEVAVISDTDSAAVDAQIGICLSVISDRRNAAANNYSDYKEQLYRVRRNILSQPQLEWEIADMARDMAISRSHFQRLYKQMFNVSIKGDMISARIKRAMQLLTNTGMRIQEIAVQCGYNNESHFMRQFKEKVGVTAVQYRKQNKAKEGA